MTKLSQVNSEKHLKSLLSTPELKMNISHEDFSKTKQLLTSPIFENDTCPNDIA